MNSVMPTTAVLQAAESKRTYVEEWRVLETYRGDRHIVGRFSSTGRYWATPPIVRLDFTARTVFTRDGQQFLLVGEPGAAVAAANFISLCAVFDERLLTTRDVTWDLEVHAQGRIVGECLPSTSIRLNSSSHRPFDVTPSGEDSQSAIGPFENV